MKPFLVVESVPMCLDNRRKSKCQYQEETKEAALARASSIINEDRSGVLQVHVFFMEATATHSIAPVKWEPSEYLDKKQ